MSEETTALEVINYEEPEQEQQQHAKKKTTSKKKKPDRTVEELHNVTPGKMSDNEKKNYINTMREILSETEAAKESYMQNAQSAFNKAAYYEQRYKKLKQKAQHLIGFSRRAISTCHESVAMAGDLEEEEI